MTRPPRPGQPQLGSRPPSRIQSPRPSPSSLDPRSGPSPSVPAAPKSATRPDPTPRRCRLPPTPPTGPAVAVAGSGPASRPPPRIPVRGPFPKTLVRSGQSVLIISRPHRSRTLCRHPRRDHQATPVAVSPIVSGDRSRCYPVADILHFRADFPVTVVIGVGAHQRPSYHISRRTSFAQNSSCPQGPQEEAFLSSSCRALPGHSRRPSRRRSGSL